MKISVYIPAFTKNPFISQLGNSLLNHKEISDVSYGLELFESDQLSFDIIIFQWPEVLVKWKRPNKEDIARITARLNHLHENNIIIYSVVHNQLPHDGSNILTSVLYQLIYNYSDKIIHLGESSKYLLKEKVNYKISPENEVVIPHGNYDNFPNTISRSEARKKLKLPDDKRVVLSFGKIRNKKEKNLLLKIARLIKKDNGILLIAGKFYAPNRKRLSYYLNRFPFWFQSNIRIHDGFIDDNEIQYYLNSSDLVVIPRIKSLNSGNVALGFTYGRVVLGQNFGVIGEDLMKTGNPVFNGFDLEEIESSLKSAFDSCENGLGMKNKKYAESTLSWDRISSMYVNLIKQSFIQN